MGCAYRRPQTADFVIDAPPLIVTTTDGKRTAVDRLHVSVDFDVTEVMLPHRLVRYGDVSSEVITEAAVVDLSGVSMTGQIMIVYDRDRGGEIVYFRNV